MPRYQQKLWRSTANTRTRRLAVGSAFGVIWLAGLIVVGVAIWLLGVVGVPTGPSWAIWLALGLIFMLVELRSPQPGYVNGDQGWTEYVVRVVMVGDDEPHPIAWRLAAALVFGPGLVGYGLIYVTQVALGLV